jgi:RND superfamily putative drug exporter
VIVIVLAVSSLGLLQLKASGVPQTDLVLSQSNAADGQKAIARHFSAGSGAPVLVAVPQESLAKTQSVLRDDKNLTDITVYSGRGPTSDATKAKIVDGKVLLSATLMVDPYSSQAETAIKSLRSTLANQVEGALVGGTTALSVDTNVTAASDLKKILPLVLLMIVIVLAILLRSLVAPLVLIATVVLSFAATMGISALVFNHIFHFPGADASVPLFGFVFLVALGVDYNIFLVSRTREEALKYGTKAAVLHSLGKTGGVITSAGVVLAATFAALGIIPILFLAQLAFIVSFGVLLDTLVIRSLLVPALFYDIGTKVWWPSRKIKR